MPGAISSESARKRYETAPLRDLTLVRRGGSWQNSDVPAQHPPCTSLKGYILTSDFLSKTLLIGAGAQKSGTSWLWTQINKSENVFLYKAKEAHYFDAVFLSEYGDIFRNMPLAGLKRRVGGLHYNYNNADLDDLEARVSRMKMTENVDTYLSYFRNRITPVHSVFGEITPSYAILNREGFVAMRDCHPDVRVFFLMRDPVDRFISSMRHHAALSGESVSDALVLSGLDKADILARSAYHKTVGLLDSVFSQKKVFYGFYESMFNDDFISRLALFGGLNKISADYNIRINASSVSWQANLDIIATLREALAPVYDFCRDRFAGQLPSTWRC